MSQRIAELEQERDLLRTVIDNLPDKIYAKDKEGRFVLNNPTHAKSLGLNSPEEMKGKTDFDFFPQELAAQFYLDEQRTIETGEPVINQEQYKNNPRDPGSPKRWSISSKVLWRDHQGKILGTVGVTRDIHEMKMAQEALHKSEEKLRLVAAQLERSNRELVDFAYVAGTAAKNHRLWGTPQGAKRQPGSRVGRLSESNAKGGRSDAGSHQ
jgi:PAS domain S-box-containing protein